MLIQTRPVVVDEDAYWARGYYYNQTGRAFWRPPGRYDLQPQLQHGPSAARFICYLFWGILAALLLWMVVLFLRLDFTPFGLTIAGNQVSITAGSYDMEFPLEEVEEVSLVDGLPTQDTPKITGPIPAVPVGQVSTQGVRAVPYVLLYRLRSCGEDCSVGVYGLL